MSDDAVEAARLEQRLRELDAEIHIERELRRGAYTSAYARAGSSFRSKLRRCDGRSSSTSGRAGRSRRGRRARSLAPSWPDHPACGERVRRKPTFKPKNRKRTPALAPCLPAMARDSEKSPLMHQPQQSAAGSTGTRNSAATGSCTTGIRERLRAARASRGARRLRLLRSGRSSGSLRPRPLRRPAPDGLGAVPSRPATGGRRG